MTGGAQELRRWRRLPLDGEVLVETGRRVDAGTVVARYRHIGAPVSIDVAARLDVAASDVAGAMCVAVGEEIAAGQVIAKVKGFLGLGGVECSSPVAGRLVAVSELTGRAVIEGAGEDVALPAWLGGRVGAIENARGVEIVARGLRVTGVFGTGGLVWGRLRTLVAGDADLTEGELPAPDEMAGRVCTGGATVTVEALRALRDAGAKALVTGGLDDLVLRDFVGRELETQNVADAGAGLIIILTGGFGREPQPPEAWRVLNDNEGREASVSGVTRLRAGVRRPEILIPLGDEPA